MFATEMFRFNFPFPNYQIIINKKLKNTSIKGCKHPPVAIIQLKSAKTCFIQVCIPKKFATYE